MKPSGDLLLIGVPSFNRDTDHWATQDAAIDFLRSEGVTVLQWTHGSGSTHFFYARCSEETQAWLMLKGCRVKNMTKELIKSVQQKIDEALADTTFGRVELEEVDVCQMFVHAVREKFGVSDAVL